MSKKKKPPLPDEAPPGAPVFDRRPGDWPHIPPTRTPCYDFGQSLRDRYGFVGRVEAIFADYWAAMDAGVAMPGWFEVQARPPSTKDQVFYALVDATGDGAVLVGEHEAREA